MQGALGTHTQKKHVVSQIIFSSFAQGDLVCVEDSCNVYLDWPEVAKTGKHSFTSSDDCCKRG